MEIDNQSKLSKNKKQKNFYNVVCWFISFVPLVAAMFLFVYCFIYEKNLFLYVVMLFVFLVFVVLFVYANKRITHKDGYTLVQAMVFYMECRKRKVHIQSMNNGEEQKVNELRNLYEFAKELTNAQIIELYEIGEDLVKRFKV